MRACSWLVVTPNVLTAWGAGRIETPRGKGPLVQFTELWWREGAAWQVVQLRYGEQPS